MWVCVLGLRFSAAPLPVLAGELRSVSFCVRAPPVPRKSWLGCAVWDFGLGFGFRLRPATPGWGVGVCVCFRARSSCTPPLWTGMWCGRVCLGSGFGCASPLLAGVLGSVCFFVRAPVPRHCLPGRAVWVCVRGLGFRLPPATPGGAVGVCVWLCARSSCTPPILAGVCGVVVCIWPRFGLRPAHPGRGVGVCLCLGARSSCTSPLLAGVCGVGGCAWARVSAALRHSWLGCWGFCVFVCALLLYPANHGWGVWSGCVCVGAGFGCAPPLLAGVLGSVCVCVRPPPVPHHSWRGCAGWVCVLGLGFWLPPATPGWGFGVCVSLCARSSCTLPILAGVCGVGVCAWTQVSAAPRHSWLGSRGLCVFVCALLLYPTTPGGGVQPGCVCFGSGFGCALPLLAGTLGSVCVCVRAPPVPRHSWLGCAVWVCVPWLGSRLRPATPGWGVGGLCVCVPTCPVPHQSWLGCALWVCVFRLGFRLRPATPGRGIRECV